MSDHSENAVNRCVDYVLKFLSTDHHRSRLPAAEQRRQHDRAVAYLNRLPPDTLSRALHQLYRAGETESRRVAGSRNAERARR
jgi:hypothetical protein